VQSVAGCSTSDWLQLAPKNDETDRTTLNYFGLHRSCGKTAVDVRARNAQEMCLLLQCLVAHIVHHSHGRSRDSKIARARNLHAVTQLTLKPDNELDRRASLSLTGPGEI
jgi:hypothetical protein